MATRTITTRLELDGEKEFKREMSEVNSHLKTLKTEMQKVEAEFQGQANTMDALTAKEKILREEIDQQEEKVRALKGALEDAAEAYGETDKRTDNFRQQLNRAQTELIKMNRELEDTERYLDEAKKSADGTADSIDGFGKELNDVDDPLGNFNSALGNLKNMLVGGAVVQGVKELAGAILEVEESTREYRQVMGTLETSSQAAGYSAEQTAETYQLLQSVLGDTQTAATATANLQAIGLEQEALMAVTYGAIGAWASYGDSIPIDGLAEAINETIQAGQVTGVFADVLNWAGVSEDEFNAKLENTTTQSERVGLVLRMLGKEDLPNLGREWLNVNEDIVEANASQERMNEAMGRLGERVAPLANAIREFGADAIDWLVDKIEAVIPVLEGMAEVATKVWDAITGGEDRDVYQSGQYGSRSVDGSHDSGLEYVPFDGYRAQLHHGERVQTREEAEWWRTAQQRLPGMTPALTAAEMQTITAAAVNATNLGRGQETITLEAKWVVNGREFYADTIEDFRAVSRSNPEVTNDR